MLELKWRSRKKKKGPPSRIAYISGTYCGVRIRESLGALERAAAQREFERRRKEIVEAIDAGRDPDLKFASAAIEYIGAGKDDRFLDLLICEIGECRVADITTPFIHQTARKLYPKAKPSTLNRQVIAPTMAVVNYCADNKLCPPIRLKRLKEGKASKRAIDRAWVDKFREAAGRLGRSELGDMELMMYTTAARLKDVEALEWPQVRIEDKIAVLLKTKNGDDRDALLTPELARALAARRPQDAKGRVFGDWARRQMYRDWQAICEEAGIDYIPPHQAGRHSFATEMMVRNKVDVKTTMEIGGWNSPGVLIANYTHPEGKRKVAEEIFGGTKEPGPRDASTTDTNSDTNVVPIVKKA
jgi:integrase